MNISLYWNNHPSGMHCSCIFCSRAHSTTTSSLSAASIGQVYQARLLKNGQLVAIKIQRPNTEEIVALDLYVLRWWGGVYNGIFRLLGRDINLQSVMDDFGKLLYAEIDYVAEAANARRFSELYAKDVAIADVFVPKVYSELTTRKVLTMEWVDGFRLTDNENLELYNLDRKKLVDTLVQCKRSCCTSLTSLWLCCILFDNYSFLSTRILQVLFVKLWKMVSSMRIPMPEISLQLGMVGYATWTLE